MAGFGDFGNSPLDIVTFSPVEFSEDKFQPISLVNKLTACKCGLLCVREAVPLLFHFSFCTAFLKDVKLNKDLSKDIDSELFHEVFQVKLCHFNLPFQVVSKALIVGGNRAARGASSTRRQADKKTGS